MATKMNKSQDQCVKSVSDWNRADKAIGCHKLSAADRMSHEANRDVPVFYVIGGGRILASAKDKAFLDKYLVDKGKAPVPVDVVWEPPPSTGRRLI